MNQPLANLDSTTGAALTVSPTPTIGAMLMNPVIMQQIETMAERMATGRCTVPDHLRGSVGDCYAITLQAFQWGMNPYAVAQKTHLVSGKLGYEAQLVNAVINSLAPTKDRLHYEWFGEWEKILGKVKAKTITRPGKEPYEIRIPDWRVEDEAGLGVRVWATMKGEDQPRTLELLLAQALTRNSTLWADDPRQQLAYLATKRWSRLYCPDVILGVYSPDELEPAPAVERDITPTTEAKPATRTAGVKDKLRAVKPSAPAAPAAEEAREVKTDDELAQELLARIKAAPTVAAVKATWQPIADFLGAHPSRQEFRPELMAAYTSRGRELDAAERAAATEADASEAGEGGAE